MQNTKVGLEKSKTAQTSSAPDLYTGEPPLKSAHNTWNKVKTDLGYALGPNVHRSWTGQLRVSQANERIVTLAAPSRFIASKIEANYADTVKRLWKKHDMVAPPRDIIFSAATERSLTAPSRPQRKPAVLSPLKDVKEVSEHAIKTTNLKPVENPRDRFTFDNFVVGASNELAFAVSRQITACRAPQYNPIVLYGANGMGKTHLLHAIQGAIRSDNPNYRVKLISSENFVSAFVSSVRGQGRDAIEAFKASLRDVDLLIVDDAHFIADKPGSQEELLHTLVSLVAQGRQILLAADRHPDKIDKASDRLKSYLSSGLVCGAFNQIVAQSEFLGTPITLETVQETLSDSRYMAGQRLTVDRIQRAVCEEFKVTLTDMVSKRRARIIARPRQVAMYLSKKLTKRSLPDIGRRFGGRDHTTVMHAVKRIDELRLSDAEFNSQIETVESILKV